MTLPASRFLPSLLLLTLGGFIRLHAATAPLLDPTDPLAGMGVNIHFTDAQPGELEELSQAGFRWVRMDFHWDKTEKAPGVYNFSAYDRLLANLDKFHIHALLILDYTNPLYDQGLPTCSDAGRTAFAKWAVAAAKHFKSRGVIWEVWNEPNGGWFWKPKANADDYAKLALTVSQAIKTAVPNAMVVGPAVSGADIKFIETVAKAGVLPYWSGITIHPYYRSNPETYAKAYDQTRALIKTYAAPGQSLDVMCGESGYAMTWPGIDEATHGKYLARLFLFDVMSGVPLTIWYDWRDDGVDPKNQEHNFGIVHHDYHQGVGPVYDTKSAYDAASTYAQQLQGAHYQERLETDSPDDYVLYFNEGRKDCIVAWTSNPQPHEVTFPGPRGTYRVTTYDGKDAGTIEAKGKLTLTLDGGPQYLKKQ